MPEQGKPGAAAQSDWMPFAMPEHVLAPPVGRPYAPPPRPSAPQVVAAAATLMVVRACLAVLAFAALYAAKDTWQAQLQQQYPMLPSQEIDRVITTTLTTTGPFTIMFVLVYLLRAARVRAGNPSARTVTMGFAVIAVGTTVYSLTRQVPMQYKVVLALDIMLDLAILVLLSLPASADWCRRRLT